MNEIATPLRVVFAGTPEAAVPSLAALVADPRFEVVGVFTQPDRPVGRKQILTPSPVKIAAEVAGIPVFQPERFREEAINQLAALAPDFLAVVAYGVILPQAALDIPRIAPVNLHFSLLPRWRGAAPVQYAIRAGDATSGVCFFRLVRALDAGPIYFTRELPLPAKTAGEVIADYAAIGAELMPDVLARVASGELPPVPQPEDGVTLAPTIAKDEGRIDWHAETADEIVWKWRAFTPWPGVFTFFAGKRVKLIGLLPAHDAPLIPSGAIRTGDARLLVGTADGTVVEVVTVQPEGRGVMTAVDWARGVIDESSHFE